ncbi:MAG: TlpA family protein disulfide reductase, partial [Algicola sp.]|nr:TlpA family protein disulfide reductase [Algicola sp.]
VTYFEIFNKRLAPSKLIEGLQAPKFSIAGLHPTGTIYNKDSFEGKVVLLDFWATWCVPCLKEMPILHEAYAQFKPLGFEILSLSGDDAIEDVSQFRQTKWQMPWKHAFLDNGQHPINKDYFVFGYPKAVLIDEKGNILADGDNARGSKLVKTLSEYYAKQGRL